MAQGGDSRGQLCEGVARDDPVEARVAEAPHRISAGSSDESRAGRWPLHHRGQGHRLVGPNGVSQHLVSGHRAYQSRGSTNTWIVPPQVSPTANASSSE